jgi:hypothetical protein
MKRRTVILSTLSAIALAAPAMIMSSDAHAAHPGTGLGSAPGLSSAPGLDNAPGLNIAPGLDGFPPTDKGYHFQ